MPSSKHSSEKYDCGKRKNKSLAKAEKEAGQPRNCETEVLEDQIVAAMLVLRGWRNS